MPAMAAPVCSVPTASRPSSSRLVSSAGSDSRIFDATVQEFLKAIPPAILNQFSNINCLGQLEEALFHIEGQQAARCSLRNLAKIRPFLNGLSDYAKVIEVFVNAKADILVFIWGPIKFCLQVASKFGQVFDKLLATYCRIRDALPNFRELENLFAPHEVIVTALVHVYTDLLEFHKRAVLFFSRPAWKIALNVTCSALSDLFDDVLKNFENSERLLFSTATVVSYREAKEARLQVDYEFKEQRERVSKANRLAVIAWLNAFPHNDQHNTYRHIRQTYLDTANWIFQNEVWMKWKDSSFDQGRLLWVTGIPGAGKSVLFSAMVDKLQQEASTMENTIVVYLYCKYNDSLRDNFTQLSRSLITSLLGDDDFYFDLLYDFAIKSKENVATTIGTLSAAICTLMSCYENVWLGIDGLDECEPAQRALLVTLIKKLLESSAEETTVSVFLTNRAEHDLENAFASAFRIKITPGQIRPDILYYSRARLLELGRFEIEETKQHDLVETIVQRSADMFLLAKLIFDMFGMCANREQFEEECASESLPEGIEAAYNRILLRIREKEKRVKRPVASKLLEILLFARRTMYLHEVQAALAIDIKKCDFDLKGRRYSQHFKEICGPLFEINSDDTVVLVHATAKELLLTKSHDILEPRSAKADFSEKIATYFSMDFFNPRASKQSLEAAARQGCFALQRYALCHWLSHLQDLIRPCEVTKTKVCGRFTNYVQKILQIPFDQNVQTCSTISGLREIENSYMAVSPWWESVKDSWNNPSESPWTDGLKHLNRTQYIIEGVLAESNNSASSTFLQEAYGKSPYFCSSMECRRFYAGFPSAKDRDSHAKLHERPYKCGFKNCIYATSGFSTNNALNKHIESYHMDGLVSKFSNLKPLSESELLNLAIDKDDGHLVEELCVQSPILVQDPGKFILRAIKKRSSTAARVLIHRFGLEKDRKKDGDRDTLVLCHAVYQNLPDIVRLLLDIGGSSLLGNYSRTSSLATAAKRNQSEIIQIILEYINPEWIIYGSTLDFAVSNKSYESVSTIIEYMEREVVPDSSERVSQLCFRMARQGDLRMVKLLLPVALKQGTLREKKYSLVHQATDTEDAASALLTIFRGAKSNKEAGSFLVNAVSRNESAIVRKLLDMGANIDAVSGIFGTALAAGAAHNHVELVQYLIDRGANVNKSAGKFGSALGAAASKGHLDMMQLLVSAGANIYAQYEEPESGHYSPLHAAASRCQDKSLEWLLSKGVDPNLCGAGGETALMAAVRNIDRLNRPERKRLHASLTVLHQHGADINRYSTSLGTALYQVIDEWPLWNLKVGAVFESVKLLVGLGARCDLPGPGGQSSALQRAIHLKEGSSSIFSKEYLDKVIRLFSEPGASSEARATNPAIVKAGHEPYLQTRDEIESAPLSTLSGSHPTSPARSEAILNEELSANPEVHVEPELETQQTVPLETGNICEINWDDWDQIDWHAWDPTFTNNSNVDQKMVDPFDSGLPVDETLLYNPWSQEDSGGYPFL